MTWRSILNSCQSQHTQQFWTWGDEKTKAISGGRKIFNSSFLRACGPQQGPSGISCYCHHHHHHHHLHHYYNTTITIVTTTTTTTITTTIITTITTSINTTIITTPLSMGFPRQERRSGLPSLSPGDLPNLGTEPTSPVWQVDSLPLRHLGSSVGLHMLLFLLVLKIKLYSNQFWEEWSS